MEKLGKRSGATHTSITSRIWDRRANLRHRKYLWRYWNNSQRKHKVKKPPNLKHPGNPGHNVKKKPKNNKYRREWRCQNQKPENIFSKVIEENILNSKKQMAINVQESYRTRNRDHRFRGEEDTTSVPIPGVIGFFRTQTHRNSTRLVAQVLSSLSGPVP